MGFEEDDEDNQIAIVLWTYRRHVQFNHFIYMLYMYDHIEIAVYQTRFDKIRYGEIWKTIWFSTRYNNRGSPITIQRNRRRIQEIQQNY